MSFIYQLERELITYVMEDQRNIKRAISLEMVARHFERIADHAEKCSRDGYISGAR